MIRRFEPVPGPLIGTVRVPGDKSISHRAVLFAAMASGASHLTGVLDSADVRSTIAAVSALGADVVLDAETHDGLSLTVTGWGDRGPTAPDAPIDCGNSGTTCRLLMGVLAGFPVTVTLDGDASLRRRPMRRVAEPLESMGACIATTDGRLPITMSGGGLHGIAYASPVASAQVKTAVLLAGLRAEGTTTVDEPVLSRDHTELLLPAFAVAVECDAATVTCAVHGPAALQATDVAVPADPSSAAFLVGAAAIVPGSEIVFPVVALNRTRMGFATVLRRMGADISVSEGLSVGSELVGTVTARYRAGLTATVVTAAEVPSLIDEIPLLAVVATAAQGTTRFEGVAELRVKETDRLASICDQLAILGAVTRSGDDWLEVDGPAPLHGGAVDSLGDHRLAMSWAVASLVATGSVDIEDFEAVSVSYPHFADDLQSLTHSTGK